MKREDKLITSGKIYQQSVRIFCYYIVTARRRNVHCQSSSELFLIFSLTKINKCRDSVTETLITRKPKDQRRRRREEGKKRYRKMEKKIQYRSRLKAAESSRWRDRICARTLSLESKIINTESFRESQFHLSIKLYTWMKQSRCARNRDTTN